MGVVGAAPPLIELCGYCMLWCLRFPPTVWGKHCTQINLVSWLVELGADNAGIIHIACSRSFLSRAYDLTLCSRVSSKDHATAQRWVLPCTNWVDTTTGTYNVRTVTDETIDNKFDYSESLSCTWCCFNSWQMTFTLAFFPSIDVYHLQWEI